MGDEGREASGKGREEGKRVERGSGMKEVGGEEGRRVKRGWRIRGNLREEGIERGLERG